MLQYLQTKTEKRPANSSNYYKSNKRQRTLSSDIKSADSKSLSKMSRSATIGDKVDKSPSATSSPKSADISSKPLKSFLTNRATPTVENSTKSTWIPPSRTSAVKLEAASNKQKSTDSGSINSSYLSSHETEVVMDTEMHSCSQIIETRSSQHQPAVIPQTPSTSDGDSKDFSSKEFCQLTLELARNSSEPKITKPVAAVLPQR